MYVFMLVSALLVLFYFSVSWMYPEVLIHVCVCVCVCVCVWCVVYTCGACVMCVERFIALFVIMLNI